MRNRTKVVILQHPRERFHPLNTARIAARGLSRVELVVSASRWVRSLTRQLELEPNTGLLYPHRLATPLDQIPLARRPASLLVLDGTWAHAHQLYRDNSWLERLPHHSLLPVQPGRYRIRGEPDRYSLSTVEAIVLALQILEPDTTGLEDLLGVFDTMIDTQIEQIRRHAAGPRTKRLKKRPRRQVPALLVDRYSQLVLVYVESVPGERVRRRPVQWTALRPHSGETFERLLRPSGAPVAARHLAHMKLTTADLDQGVTMEQLRRDWEQFAGDSVVLVAWNQSTLDLTSAHAPGAVTRVLLKAAYCNVHKGTSGSLEAVVQREGLEPKETPFGGRAATRMGQALAVLEHLIRVRHSIRSSREC